MFPGVDKERGGEGKNRKNRKLKENVDLTENNTFTKITFSIFLMGNKTGLNCFLFCLQVRCGAELQG